MSEVDTVWAWGGQPSPPPISKYFSEIAVKYFRIEKLKENHEQDSNA